jgi:hypothetical protein
VRRFCARRHNQLANVSWAVPVLKPRSRLLMWRAKPGVLEGKKYQAQDQQSGAQRPILRANLEGKMRLGKHPVSQGLENRGKLHGPTRRLNAMTKKPTTEEK